MFNENQSQSSHHSVICSLLFPPKQALAHKHLFVCVCANETTRIHSTRVVSFSSEICSCAGEGSQQANGLPLVAVLCFLPTAPSMRSVHIRAMAISSLRALKGSCKGQGTDSYVSLWEAPAGNGWEHANYPACIQGPASLNSVLAKGS